MGGELAAQLEPLLHFGIGVHLRRVVQARIGESAVVTILWLPCWAGHCGSPAGPAAKADASPSIAFCSARDSPAHDLSGPKIDGSLITSKPVVPIRMSSPVTGRNAPSTRIGFCSAC